MKAFSMCRQIRHKKSRRKTMKSIQEIRKEYKDLINADPEGNCAGALA